MHLKRFFSFHRRTWPRGAQPLPVEFPKNIVERSRRRTTCRLIYEYWKRMAAGLQVRQPAGGMRTLCAAHVDELTFHRLADNVARQFVQRT